MRMSRTYKATGINLKGMPLGEADRLLTILTREFGLLRVVAPGVRKHKSKLGGRSELFVVNQLLLSKGRSLDKVIQAETLESFPGLSQDLGKLTASQYIAELVLYQALSHQAQEDLFSLLIEHFHRLAQGSSQEVLARLAHATFHLLALGGFAPQTQFCCLTRHPLVPDFTDPTWRIGFSMTAGGTVSLVGQGVAPLPSRRPAVAEPVSLGATELLFLQQLARPDLPQSIALPDDSPELDLSFSLSHPAWSIVEQTLRCYAQHCLDRVIRSAALIDACLQPQSTASQMNHATV